MVAAPGDHRDPAKLVALINREGVDTLHFVPSMLQAFLQDEDVVSCTSLKRIVCSGEALPADAQQQVFAKLPQAGLFDACRSLGVVDSALRRWVKQLQAERQGVTPKSKALTPEQQKIQELEARINRLEREKAILKKATALLMSDELDRTR